MASDQILRLLFRVSSEGASGTFRIEAGGAATRLELELGFVHAISVAGENRDTGDETLRRLLERLPDDATARFDPGSPPRTARPVPAFHPAPALRARLEGALPVDVGPRLGHRLAGARLRLLIPPHGSCLADDEAPLAALLSAPRSLDELLASGAAAPERVAAFLAFAEAAGILAVEDPSLQAAYSALGLPAGAPPEEVRRAYRELAREIHPDRHPRASDPERQALAERFREATLAYRRLFPGEAG